ncbi:hypothetical protein D3C78_1508220 [compost metagenome]
MSTFAHVILASVLLGFLIGSVTAVVHQDNARLAHYEAVKGGHAKAEAIKHERMCKEYPFLKVCKG